MSYYLNNNKQYHIESTMYIRTQWEITLVRSVYSFDFWYVNTFVRKYRTPALSMKNSMYMLNYNHGIQPLIPFNYFLDPL